MSDFIGFSLAYTVDTGGEGINVRSGVPAGLNPHSCFEVHGYRLLADYTAINVLAEIWIGT